MMHMLVVKIKNKFESDTVSDIHLIMKKIIQVKMLNCPWSAMFFPRLVTGWNNHKISHSGGADLEISGSVPYWFRNFEISTLLIPKFRDQYPSDLEISRSVGYWSRNFGISTYWMRKFSRSQIFYGSLTPRALTLGHTRLVWSRISMTFAFSLHYTWAPDMINFYCIFRKILQ